MGIFSFDKTLKVGGGIKVLHSYVAVSLSQLSDFWTSTQFREVKYPSENPNTYFSQGFLKFKCLNAM